MVVEANWSASPSGAASELVDKFVSSRASSRTSPPTAANSSWTFRQLARTDAGQHIRDLYVICANSGKACSTGVLANFISVRYEPAYSCRRPGVLDWQTPQRNADQTRSSLVFVKAETNLCHTLSNRWLEAKQLEKRAGADQKKSAPTFSSAARWRHAATGRAQRDRVLVCR